MAEVSAAEKNAERRKRVFLGTLPPDFLRITAASQQQQEAADQQAALALQQQMVGMPYAQPMAGRLSITVAQAKLVKNYGMTRMDPYVRLRVGHCVYETHTDPNGGKNPRWNKVVQCYLPQGVNTIHLEIFDECSFTMDELIAWNHIVIPQAVLNGETHDDWYPLNGKQGDGMEGMINLVLSYSNAPVQPYGLYPSAVAPVVMVPTVTPPLYGIRPTYAPVSVYTAPPAPPAPPQLSEQELKQPYGLYPSAVAPVVMVPTVTPPLYDIRPTYAPVSVYTAPPAPPAPPQLSEQELKQIEEMFPNMDKEVIKSVFEANRGNKDGTVNSLLQMSE